MDQPGERVESEFSELLDTTIESAEARAALQRLAEEQAALRRIATLVAAESSPDELFQKVAEETANLLDRGMAALMRDDGDGFGSVVAFWGRPGATELIGMRIPLDGDSNSAQVIREGRPVRVEPYLGRAGTTTERTYALGTRATVGCPIVVGGSIWGVLSVASMEGEPYPPSNTEERLVEISDLLAIAIANAESREALTRLADEQARLAAEHAALRRVATLVAKGVPPAEMFSAVSREVRRLFGSDFAAVGRFHGDGPAIVTVGIATDVEGSAIGTRFELEEPLAAAAVYRTGRSARRDHVDWTAVDGPVGAVARRFPAQSTVASPITVEGRLWGAMVVAANEPLPTETEKRLENFTDLVATAIANIDARTELTASRARVVAAEHEERRRVVRDLHDGAQQRLVHTIITLKLAQEALERDAADAASLVGEALEHAQRTTAELRELAHGILPATLTAGGLQAGVEALASRMPMPVEVNVCADRLPATIEATAYFVVAEALTNVAKHARAATAWVAVRVENGTLRVEVRDDGVGGARPEGSGLQGLGDRLAALDGRLHLDSPAGGGTLVAAAIPIAASATAR